MAFLILEDTVTSGAEDPGVSTPGIVVPTM